MTSSTSSPTPTQTLSCLNVPAPVLGESAANSNLASALLKSNSVCSRNAGCGSTFVDVACETLSSFKPCFVSACSDDEIGLNQANIVIVDGKTETILNDALDLVGSDAVDVNKAIIAEATVDTPLRGGSVPVSGGTVPPPPAGTSENQVTVLLNSLSLKLASASGGVGFGAYSKVVIRAAVVSGAVVITAKLPATVSNIWYDLSLNNDGTILAVSINTDKTVIGLVTVTVLSSKRRDGAGFKITQLIVPVFGVSTTVVPAATTTSRIPSKSPEFPSISTLSVLSSPLAVATPTTSAQATENVSTTKTDELKSPWTFLLECPPKSNCFICSVSNSNSVQQECNQKIPLVGRIPEIVIKREHRDVQVFYVCMDLTTARFCGPGMPNAFPVVVKM
ncbi:hypothetical protein BDR26DRAFT_984310 [Obelidium mucronatum]|nr:hypothetical protein BDR26DRAFT_984310 [Obelidium mucronatum]